MVGDRATEIVGAAIAAGYRHIDTSEEYGNEDAVGRGVRESEVPARRSSSPPVQREMAWRGARLRSAPRLAATARSDYVDLFLIHWPNPWQDATWARGAAC